MTSMFEFLVTICVLTSPMVCEHNKGVFTRSTLTDESNCASELARLRPWITLLATKSKDKYTFIATCTATSYRNA